MSLSDSLIQLTDLLDDIRAKISARINSKRPLALSADLALKVQNKTLTDIKDEVDAIYRPHINTTDGNPHNLTLALVDAMSATNINALADDKLTDEANTVDFIGHPSVDGIPLGNPLSIFGSATKHCRFEKHPGDVLVLNMLNGINTEGKEWKLNQIKCPRANAPEPLLPLAYHTELLPNNYPVGFGDGLMVINQNSGSLPATVRKSTAVTSSELANFSFQFPSPIEGSVTNFNKSLRCDGVYYSVGNIIGQFYYSDILNTYSARECVYPVNVSERNAAGEVVPSSSSNVELGSSVFGNPLSDYCTFTGAAPASAAFTVNGRLFTRDVLMEETDTEFIFTVYTRVRFSFSTYKRELIEFFVREEYKRSKASSTPAFVKTYTSPKFTINYATDINQANMVFDDTGGLAPFFKLPNCIFTRSALYRGKEYIYGYTYPTEGVCVGGKFWKVKLLPNGSFDFSNTYETLFEPTHEALGTLINVCHLGVDAEGYANYYGRDIHGNHTVSRTLSSGVINVTNPVPNGPSDSIDAITAHAQSIMPTPGAAYKLFGYNDGGITTIYSRNRFLYGVPTLQDTQGVSSISHPSAAGASDTTFPYALQQALAADVLANMADFPGLSGVILDIVVPPQANLTPFLIAYPYYSDDNAQLAGQTNANYHLYSFQTNVRVGNIASYSNLTRVYRARRSFPQGISLNNQLKEAWTDNTLCTPIIINQYEGSTHRVYMDTLPVFAFSRSIGNRTAFSDCLIIRAAWTATAIDVTPGNGYSVTLVNSSRNSWMTAPPTVQAKYSLTNAIIRFNSPTPAIMDNRVTSDPAGSTVTSMTYSGPWTEYLAVVGICGHLPYRIGDRGGVVNTKLRSVGQLLWHQLITIAATPASRNYFVYFTDNVGSATPDLNYQTNDVSVRSEGMIEISRGTATRTALTPAYREPRVGISSYFVSTIPNYRSIMTKPNANV